MRGAAGVLRKPVDQWSRRKRTAVRAVGSSSRSAKQSGNALLGQPIGNLRCQANNSGAIGITHPCRQVVTKLKNRVRLLHGDQSRVSQHQASVRRAGAMCRPMRASTH